METLRGVLLILPSVGLCCSRISWLFHPWKTQNCPWGLKLYILLLTWTKSIHRRLRVMNTLENSWWCRVFNRQHSPQSCSHSLASMNQYPLFLDLTPSHGCRTFSSLSSSLLFKIASPMCPECLLFSSESNEQECRLVNSYQYQLWGGCCVQHRGR